jgi:hypothetical protein
MIIFYLFEVHFTAMKINLVSYFMKQKGKARSWSLEGRRREIKEIGIMSSMLLRMVSA